MRRAVVIVVFVGLLTCGCAAGADKAFTPADEPGGVVPAGATRNADAGDASAQDTGTRDTGAGSAPSPGVRTIVIGPEMRIQFEWPSGLESGQIPIVNAISDHYTRAWKAVVTHGQDVSYTEGVEASASRDVYDWVQSFLNVKASARGVAKIYAVRVTSMVGRGAEVDVCLDASGVRLTDAATGRLAASQPSWTKPPTSIYLQVAGVRRDDDGKWRIKIFQHADYPHPRAKECVR